MVLDGQLGGDVGLGQHGGRELAGKFQLVLQPPQALAELLGHLRHGDVRGGHQRPDSGVRTRIRSHSTQRSTSLAGARR